tara:strand:+ start:681 stop:875 length:195 start_codon:yes stop_codon:yes gene_type:complete
MKELNKLQLISTVVTVLGAFVAIYVYIDSKQGSKQKADILVLEKQVKELELANQLHLARHNGLM